MWRHVSSASRRHKARSTFHHGKLLGFSDNSGPLSSGSSKPATLRFSISIGLFDSSKGLFNFFVSAENTAKVDSATCWSAPSINHSCRWRCDFNLRMREPGYGNGVVVLKLAVQTFVPFVPEGFEIHDIWASTV